MAVDIEEMDADELAALPEAERLRLLMGEESPTEETGAPATEATAEQPAPQGDTQPAEAQPTAESSAAPEQSQKPPPGYVPHGALAEARGKFARFANDPDALLQRLAELGYQAPGAAPAESPPGLAWEQPEAVQAIVSQAVAPLHQEVQLLRQERDEARQAREMDELRKEFGPDVDHWLAVLNESRPDMAELSPRDRALHVQGLLWSDPEYRESQLAAEREKAKAEATAAAEQKVATALAGSKTQTPVTLSGLSPSADDDVPDIESMNADDIAAMPEAKRMSMRQKAMNSQW